MQTYWKQEPGKTTYQGRGVTESGDDMETGVLSTESGVRSQESIAVSADQTIRWLIALATTSVSEATWSFSYIFLTCDRTVS